MQQNIETHKPKQKLFDWQKSWPMKLFRRFDQKVDGALSFFFKHYGKSKFMIKMSKKAQVLGLEKLFNKGPKAFFYFFMFYLIRDTILYIIIPIYIAKFSSTPWIS